MSVPQFHTARGLLTAYALACGYIHVRVRNTVSVTLWREHGCYHVRAHDSERGRLWWDSFITLTDARKRFNSI